MHLNKLENYQSIENMRRGMLQRDLSKRTYENYLFAVKLFLEKLSVEDPDELIERIKSGSVNPIGLFEEFIRSFAPERFNGSWKIPRKSLKTYVAGVKKFLRANGIKIYAEDVRDLMPVVKRTYNGKPAKKGVLRKLLDNMALRGKVILCLMSGSGLRLGCVVKLQLRDIVMEDPDSLKGEWLMKIPYAVEMENEVMRKMKGAASDDQRVHMVFMSPECVGYFKDYLEYRRRKGEELMPESPVVTVEREGARWGEKYGGFLEYHSAWNEINKVMLKLGLRRNGERGLHPHSFRAYFRTMLNRAGMDDATAERFMAHAGGYMQREYYLPEIETLRKEYVRALPFIELRGPTIKLGEIARQAQRIEEMEGKLKLQEKVRLEERGRLQREKAELENRVRQLEKQLGMEQRNKEDLQDRIHRTEEKLVELTKIVEKLIENPSS